MSLRRILEYAAFLIVWATALFGASQVHQVKTGYMAILCGRWGCLAPTSSLLGMHLIGLTLLTGATFGVAHFLPSMIPRLRLLLFWAGAVGLLAIVGQAFYTWKPESISEVARLIPYSIANQTDAPAIQALLLSCLLRWLRKEPEVQDTVKI